MGGGGGGGVGGGVLGNLGAVGWGAALVINIWYRILSMLWRHTVLTPSASMTRQQIPSRLLSLSWSAAIVWVWPDYVNGTAGRKRRREQKTLSDLSTHPHAAHTRQKGEGIKSFQRSRSLWSSAISGNCQMWSTNEAIMCFPKQLVQFVLGVLHAYLSWEKGHECHFLFGQQLFFKNF